MTRCETLRIFFFVFKVSFFFSFSSKPRENKKSVQTPHLLEARLGRQLLDGIPAVPQDSLVTVDVRDLGAASGGVDVAVVVFEVKEKEKEKESLLGSKFLSLASRQRN